MGSLAYLNVGVDALHRMTATGAALSGESPEALHVEPIAGAFVPDDRSISLPN